MMMLSYPNDTLWHPIVIQNYNDYNQSFTGEIRLCKDLSWVILVLSWRGSANLWFTGNSVHFSNFSWIAQKIRMLMEGNAGLNVF